MKTIYKLLGIILLSISIFSGCNENMSDPTSVSSNQGTLLKESDPSVTGQGGIENYQGITLFDFAKVKAEYQMRLAEHLDLLKSKNHTPIEMNPNHVIHVPADYPTIQEAVDNAAPGNKIIVMSGNYNEDLFVATPDLEITASGQVILTGTLFIGANTILRKFILIEDDPNGYHVNIFSPNARITDCTISGGFVGIALAASSCTIEKNTIFESGGGIVVFGTSDNTIDKNTLTDNYIIDITLQNAAYNNVLTGNSCSGSGPIGLGVSDGSHDNQLKNNDCSGKENVGILLINTSNNTVGSGNKANDNGQYGIFLVGTSTNNVVEKSTATGNGSCDIVQNLGTTGNTQTKNRADCVEGF